MRSSILRAALACIAIVLSQAPAPAAEPAGPSTQAVMAERLRTLSNLGPPRPDPSRQWTLVAYLCGDNDLEESILADLNEMEAGLPDKGVEIIALIDRAKGYDKSDGDWTDARVYRLRRDSDRTRIGSELLLSPGELNTGDPRTLRTFLQAAIKAFPARRYALSMNGHGAGWPGLGVDSDAPDAPAGTAMFTVAALREALSDALRSVNVPRLDLVNMDMCLMGQIEVAAEIRDLASVLVASEAPVPNEGMPYDAVLPAFVGERTPAEVAADMVKGFAAFYEKANHRGTTIAAIDLSKMTPVVREADKLFGALKPLATADWANLSRAVYFAESYAGRADHRRGKGAIASVDLLDCAGRMKANIANFPASGELKALTDAVRSAVIASNAGRIRRLSTGLALYAPLRGDQLRDGYGRLRFSSECSWPALVATLHTAQKERGGAPRIDNLAIVSREGEPVRELTVAAAQAFKFTVDGSNILWTIAEQAQPVGKSYKILERAFIFGYAFDEKRRKAMEGASELIDLLMPQYTDGKNDMRQPASGLTFGISNGTEIFHATLDYSDPSSLRYVRVPAIYDHPSTGRLDADLFFDTNWLTASQVQARIRLPDGTITVRGIRPDPAAQITLLHEMNTEDGKITYAESGRTAWGKGLSFVPVFHKPGRYAMIVSAESIAGASGRVAFDYRMVGNPVFDSLVQLADKLDPRELVGNYEWHLGIWAPLRQNYVWQPTDFRLQLKPDAKSQGVLSYVLRGGKAPVEGFAVPESHRIPTLTFWTKQDPKATPAAIENYTRADDMGYIRSDFFVALVLQENDRRALVLWDPAREIVIKAIRTDGALLPGIIGRWCSADGRITLLIDRNSYQTFMGPMLIDRGPYRTDGGSLITTNSLGLTERQDFLVRGDTLILVNQRGLRTVLNRVK